MKDASGRKWNMGITVSSPWKESGRETPPAADWGPSGKAAMRECSSASDCTAMHITIT